MLHIWQAWQADWCDIVRSPSLVASLVTGLQSNAERLLDGLNLLLCPGGAA